MNVKKLAWVVVALTLLQPISSRKRTKSKSRKCYGLYTCQRATQPGASKKCVCIDISQFCDQSPDCPNGEDESKCCQSLSNPQNGNVMQNRLDHASVATYTCKSGFLLVGDSARTCMANNKWSGNQPTCNKIACQSLSNPENGNVMQNGLDHNSVATYTCKSGFLLVGDSTRTCMTNNMWSGKQPTCNKIVDGGWANWAEFSTCSRTCGCGSKIRFRSCTNPRPAEGGMDCVGDAAEAMECTLKNCPVDGVWTEFSPFSACSGSCADAIGTTTRTRSCTNPSASDDGAQCQGSPTETLNCNIPSCLDPEVWGEWSGCSGRCLFNGLQGIRTRTRMCVTDPCYHCTEETQTCTLPVCPVL